MYPIKFENLYFNKVWGGRLLENLGRKLPEGDIGESWDIACHKNGMSIVSNGEHKGMRFDKLIEKYGKDLLGDKISDHRFPLLVKLISADQSLSLQVHPDDSYAQLNENEFGKNEAWYILEAKEGAQIILGTEYCDRDTFKNAIINKKLDLYIKKINVKQGEIYFVKSGLVHSIGDGIIILEIQQNSDVTYRVYDFGRGREIQIDKALDVINFNLKSEKSIGKELYNRSYKKEMLCQSEYFNIEKYIIHNKIIFESNNNHFYLFTCVEGNGIISSNGEIMNLSRGDSILIPAKLGEFRVYGNFTLLRSYVPD